MKRERLTVLMNMEGVAYILGVPTATVQAMMTAGICPRPVWTAEMQEPRWPFSSIPEWLRCCDALGITTNCGPPLPGTMAEIENPGCRRGSQEKTVDR